MKQPLAWLRPKAGLQNSRTGQNLAIDGFFGGAWYVTSDNSNGIAGDDNKVLLAQLTTDGDLSGQFLVQVFPNGDSDGLGDLVTLTFGPYVDTDAPAFVDFPCGCDCELFRCAAHGRSVGDRCSVLMLRSP